MDLAATSSLLRLLSEPTRVRLLAVLEHEELTVAELASILELAQPRVSTHLARLKDAGLVRDRRSGVSAYYRARLDGDAQHGALLDALRQSVEDAVLDADARRLPQVLAQRAHAQGWADTVAGDMERHYSPGRTWETLARSMLRLLEPGDVLDIASGDGVTAELLAPQAKSIVCVDSSAHVVEAARKRLADFDNVEVHEADMHELASLGRRRFDLVLLMQALTYAEQPAQAIAETARLLRPGGRLLATTLARHRHKTAVAPFDHRNLGFRREQLASMASKAGLDVVVCERLTRERKPPHFEVLCLLARKPCKESR